jgi:DNA-binding MarR family transcriptional regulator
MQDAGLLTREPAPHDRRVMVVHLTDAGRAMQEPITEMWRSLERISVRDLTPEQVETFTMWARLIERSVRDSGRQTPAG